MWVRVGTGAVAPEPLFTPKAIAQASTSESVHNIRKGLIPPSLPRSSGVERGRMFHAAWVS